MPAVSVIVCSRTPSRLAATRQMYARLLPDAELVAVENPPSLTWGYNRGIERAQGECLVFSHDDLEIVSQDLAVWNEHTPPWEAVPGLTRERVKEMLAAKNA
jgi:hypothetical protein